MLRSNARGKFNEIKAKLENDVGTLEEAEIWLTQLKMLTEDIDLSFLNSDYMYQLEQRVALRKKAYELEVELGDLHEKEALVNLAKSIFAAENQVATVDMLDLDARYLLLQKSALHPNVENVVYEMHNGLTPEMVVDILLSHKPINL